MVDVSFTRPEVEAEAGVEPWGLARTFSSEIDPESMGDTAAVYARAAGEADDAGTLAEAATEHGAESGSLNGTPLVDSAGRIDDTARGLQGNGADMDEVVGWLVRAMNLALDTVSSVNTLIDGAGGPPVGHGMTYTKGLDVVYQENFDAAQAELSRSIELINAASRAAAQRADAPGTVAATVTLDNGETMSFSPTQEGVDGLAADVGRQIRKRYLESVAESAKSTHTEMTDTIDDYRSKLTGYGQELQLLGYDLSGPLDLWTTEGQAEWAADQLAKELAKDEPDPEMIQRFTQGLDGITDAIYGDSNDPGDPSRRLTAAERAYLEEFFAGLDADDIAALGNKIDGWNGGKMDIANGLGLLTNPAVGGFDVGDAQQREQLPDVVKRFVYEWEDGALFGNGTGPTDPDELTDELRRFNGFGDVLGHMTITPGDQFATDIAHAAVGIQERSSQQHGLLRGFGDVVPNTGSSDLLSAASLNADASAGLLLDDDFRNSLLVQTWQDSDGAADLVRSGTTIPEGVDPKSDAAHPFIEAAYETVVSSVDHKDYVLGNGPTSEDLAAHHGALQSAVGDMAIRYMDLLSVSSQDTWYEDGRFNVDRDVRNGLFQLMDKADPMVNDQFFRDVAAWQGATAYAAFAEDADGNGDNASPFARLGTVAGAVEHAKHLADTHIPDATAGTRRQATLVTSVSTAAGIVNTLGEYGRIGAPVSAGAFGLAEMLRHSLPDPTEAESRAKWDALEFGHTPIRTIVANAAIEADYRGAGEYSLPDLASPGVHESDVRLGRPDSDNPREKGYEDIENAKYDGYRDALLAAYNQATGVK
ncbi:hypothetical protein [Streptomyces avicenniae]|uniref:hypothetical protein n=1 Tax=Streptomyces avicenniae TaxID=500153 RepID=UPI000699C154|nr:hypothetical protein [Streptomyces avicenniae]